MSLNKISADDIKSQIHSIFKSHDFDYNGKIEILTEINELGKGLIDNLSSADETIYDIKDEMGDIIEEYDKIMQELDEAEDEYTYSNDSIIKINARIEELETKGEENLTASEKRELEWLRGQKENYETKSTNSGRQIESLRSSSQSTIGRLDGFNEELSDIADATSEYKDAGKAVQNSAKKYGYENLADGHTLKRQRNSWWSWLGIGVGENSKHGQYVKAAGLENVGKTVDGTQWTYYDAEDHGFVAEYDVMEAKGGNEVQGKLHHQTVRAFSYGQTIQDASDIVKDKAEDTKKEKKDE